MWPRLQLLRDLFFLYKEGDRQFWRLGMGKVHRLACQWGDTFLAAIRAVGWGLFQQECAIARFARNGGEMLSPNGRPIGLIIVFVHQNIVAQDEGRANVKSW